MEVNIIGNKVTAARCHETSSQTSAHKPWAEQNIVVIEEIQGNNPSGTSHGPHSKVLFHVLCIQSLSE